MSAISEEQLQYWAELLSDRCFLSERDLRKAVFEISEQRCRQSWSVPEGKNTIPENLAFARRLPVVEIDGEWKIRVTEYLSNMTSDFSDGTNGEPTGYPPSGGDLNSAAGMPDYKYVERLKKRKEKLKALIQRRDPDEIEKRIGEAEEFEDADTHKDVEFDPDEVGDEVLSVESLMVYLKKLGLEARRTEDGLTVSNPATEHYMIYNDLNSPELLESLFLGWRKIADFERDWETLFGDLAD